MLLTQLEYFLALAREQHFGRAAAASFVSPSTLSEAVRKLEAELGVPLVHRGRSFEGLTGEGELVLVWARRIVADHRALSDEIAVARERLATRARFGVIPSGIAAVSRIVTRLSDANPLVSCSIASGLTSEEIVARLRSYELDAGIIHPSAADGPDLHTVPLASVRAVVVCGADAFDADVDEVTGEMLARAPLCLLSPGMRARQVFDQEMHAHGLDLAPRVETDSVEALLALVSEGSWTAVVPESSLGGRLDPGLRVLPLVDPEVRTPLALVRIADDPAPPLSTAIDAVSRPA
ncbi:LysR family transcriptional regulator [Leucobacter weissii]|uniref:LysR family transcriptional regulator n=1 Tax=Leucobacter weissii TaxID=1983706 RepID=A0A939SD11_9MICO|nr:LysR family transcriptional regulator [Leucobacter weissii]MBO1902980.1 LysR family transcriptional regulator [Leucobacter weissii]